MKRLLVLVTALLTAACAMDETLEKPAELVDFEQKAEFEQVWSVPAGRVFAAPLAGDRTKDLRLGLVPASDGTNLYIATHDGSVQAFRLADGERVWHHQTRQPQFWGKSSGTPFSAGPSVGAGQVIIGALNGEVLALDSTTGERQWSQKVNGELLAPPLLTSGLVVLRTTDGRILALDATNGSRRWDTVREVPPLTIRGAGSPATDHRYVFAGFDNGKVAALSMADGTTVWETAVANPGGASELAGIVDVDGDLKQFGNEVYATSYNGHLAALAVESGEILWRRELSSVAGPEVAFGNVFATDVDSVVRALDRLSGTTIWTQEALRARRLTAPAVLDDMLVVGDFEGYLHFLSSETGDMLARISHFGEPIRATPLVVDDYLVVISEDSRLAVYRRTDSE